MSELRVAKERVNGRISFLSVPLFVGSLRHSSSTYLLPEGPTIGGTEREVERAEKGTERNVE